MQMLLGGERSRINRCGVLTVQKTELRDYIDKMYAVSPKGYTDFF